MRPARGHACARDMVGDFVKRAQQRLRLWRGNKDGYGVERADCRLVAKPDVPTFLFLRQGMNDPAGMGFQALRDGADDRRNSGNANKPAGDSRYEIGSFRRNAGRPSRSVTGHDKYAD